MIEFLGVLPLASLVILVIWQFTMAGFAELVAMNAAMEGAHAMVMHSTPQQEVQAVVNSSFGLLPQNPPPGDPKFEQNGQEDICIVSLPIPTVGLPGLRNNPALHATAVAVMQSYYP